MSRGTQKIHLLVHRSKSSYSNELKLLCAYEDPGEAMSVIDTFAPVVKGELDIVPLDLVLGPSPTVAVEWAGQHVNEAWAKQHYNDEPAQPEQPQPLEEPDPFAPDPAFAEVPEAPIR